MGRSTELADLKELVAEAQAESSRAAGALDQTMKQLKSEFGCKTLDAAREMLANLEQDEKKLSSQFDRELEKFKEKYKEQLE